MTLLGTLCGCDSIESSSFEHLYSAKSEYDAYHKPPVNCEKALTKEEAERLRGTGYHGCRPDSSAENSELAAAQVKCKKCGYHSRNGTNSLCDYCSWVEKYGDK